MGRGNARTVVSIDDVALCNGLPVRYTPLGGGEVVIGRVTSWTPREDGSIQATCTLSGGVADLLLASPSYSMSCALKGSDDA